MIQATLIKYAAIIGAILLLIFGVYRWGYSSAEADRDLEEGKELIERQAEIIELKESLTKKVSDLDEKHQTAINSKNDEIDQLRRSISAGTVRLSVKQKAPLRASQVASAPSIAYAETRCELDTETSQNLISITADGDRAINDLTALQEYVKIHVVDPLKTGD